jgi:hypothetical protein
MAEREAGIAPIRFLAVLAFLLVYAASAAFAQTAAARKDFLKRLAQSTIVTKKGAELVPAYKLSADGPDATHFVYHAAMMSPSVCRSLLTETFVAKFIALGFTKLVCTDDADERFAFDLVAQTVTPDIARRDYAEMIRRSVTRQLGAKTPQGYNVSAEGPDATYYVHHQSAANLADCNPLLEERFLSGLRQQGFVRLSCTDDRSTTFAFDLEAQPRATAFALLEEPQ